jgi:hypothetical protein
MTGYRGWLALLALACCLAAAAPAHAAESSPSVPPDSPYYRDLDKLVAFGLALPPILGQKPYSRSEFARMTAEAMGRWKEEEGGDPPAADSFESYIKAGERRRQIGIILKRLESEFGEELTDMGAIEGERMRYRVHPLEEFVFYGTYLSSAPTTIPQDNGRGTINAVINPLRDYDLGRHPVFGTVSAEEAVARFKAGKYFSGYFRPRFEVDIPRVDPMGGHVYVQNAQGAFRAGNFEFRFGRDSMVWGPGDRGSLLFSTNPRPFDGVWITNPTPARLPWVFKHLGRWRYTLYGINLGPEYVRKWAWLAGYKFSLAPARYVELGFGHAVQIGGEGAPTPSFLDVLGEFTGFRPAGTDPNSPNLTNHTFEIDLLVRIPQLRGLQIYGNVAIEDYWKSVKKTLTQGCSYLGGIYLPALNPSGTMDLRAEYVHTNPLEFRHTLYSDGFTLDRRLIGTDAGPDADTLHILFRHTLSRRMWYGVTADWDFRRSNTYAELRNPDGTAGPIVKVANGPSEQRWRGLLDLDVGLRKGASLHLTGGYERVRNQRFVAGADCNNFVVAAALSLDLDRHFAFAAR